MARVRFAGTDPSTVPTPPAGKSTLFVDINDLSYKAKLPDGSIIPISVTEEYLQDIVGDMFQTTTTIDFTYDDVNGEMTFDVIESGLDHTNGGPSKHDATEIDYERADVDKIDIQASSDEVESALTNLDDLKLSRSGVQPMTGNLDLGANNITNVDLVDGRDLEVDGSKLDTIETNAKDDQVASEVPFTPAGVLTSTDVQAALAELDEVVSEAQVVEVSLSPGTGQFSSIKAAIDSISDASATKPYIVKVSPGIFNEDPITMKNYVILRGTDDSSSIIIANDSTQPLITGVSSSEIHSIQLRGPTDSGVPLIYYTGDVSTGAGFSVIECAFTSTDRIFQVDNNNTHITSLRAEGNRITSTNNIGSILYADGSDSQQLFVFIDGLIYRDKVGPFPSHLLDIKGQQATVAMNNILVELDSNTTHAIHLENGCELNLQSCAFSGMSVGIHSHNVGVGQVIQTSALALRDCSTADIWIQHPDTNGNIDGVADISNLIIDDDAPISINLGDLSGGGYLLSGPLVMGRKYSYTNQVLDLLEASPAMGVVTGGELTANTGFQVDVSAGFGYVMVQPFPDHRLRRVDWNNTSITLSANEDVYVYFNSSGILTSAASISNSSFTILLGRVVTNDSGIELIDQSPIDTHHPMNHMDEIFRNALGPIYESGSIVTENTTPFTLDVTTGNYYFSLSEFSPSGGTGISFIQYYRDGLGDWNRSTITTVNSTQYDDDSGTLQNLTSNYYTKHTLYVSGEGSKEKYFLVLGQNEYSALAAVEGAPLPMAPSWIKDSVVPIASIVIKEGDANIVEFLDIRPQIGFKSTGVSASSDHGNLLGLADDDHPQYLLVNGSRPVSGTLDMGGNPITNVGNVDGVDISAHATRHLPVGTDPLATAAPDTNLNGNTTNAEGNANSFARSNHTHAINDVTTSIAGLMTATDKVKLDTVETSAKDDQDANEVPYDNTLSGLIATDVQAAIDENDSRLDSIEAETYVNSFNSRTGDVVPATSDYDAVQVDNTPSGNISSTNVQDAINELDSEKQPIDSDLTAIAGQAGTGILTRTGTGTATTRTIQAASGETTVSNGDGVAGDPTIGLPNVGPGTGSVGSASQSLSITTDDKGRVTNRIAQAISILSTQITDFAAAVRSVILTGFTIGSNTAIAATDTVLQAFGKTQGQIDERIQGPASSTDNAVVRYDGGTGKLAQNSQAFIDDNGGIIAGDLIRPSDTADTTNANIRYNSNELQGRVNNIWRTLATVPTTITQTADTSTTSATYTTIAGMTATPAAGTYTVIFQCSANLADDAEANIAMFVDGVEQTAYTRTLIIDAIGGFGPVGAYEVPVTIILPSVTLNGAQAITAQFNELGNDTLTIGPRSLTTIPIAR